jgi:dipeptidyl aminopeptidase/acylaminoacyl peptidase
MLLAGAALPDDVNAQAKRILDHDIYEVWDTIGGETIARNGRWVLYNRIRYDRDGALVVRATTGNTVHVFDRATGANFDAASDHVVFTLKPMRDSVLQARRDRRRPEQMPRDTLAILSLGSGTITRVPGVRSVRVPEEGGTWIAYQIEREGGTSTAAAAAAAAAAAPAAPGAGRAPGTQRGAAPGGGNTGASARGGDAGSPLLIRNLTTGIEHRIDDVVAYSVSKDGRRVAYATAADADSVAGGVFIMEPATAAVTPVMPGSGDVRRLVFDEAGEQLAFLNGRADGDDETTAFALYHWQPRFTEARQVAAENTPGVRPGWWVSESGNISFSRNGERIFFGAAPRPDPDVNDGLLPEERVRVDVWHWEDPLIQPVQLRRLQQERRRSYQAVVHLRDDRVVQLEDEQLPSVSVGARGNSDFATGSAAAPYARLSSWDSPGWSDDYLVNVRTGERTLVRERAQGTMSLSPGGRYAVWYDNAAQGWMALDTRTRRVTDLTSSIPFPIHDEDHDQPSPARPQGSAGWLEGDAAFLVYDRFDIWAVDPTGRTAPRGLTDGAGRRLGITFRLVRLDRDEPYVPTDRPLLLSAFDPATKAAGFYTAPARGGTPQRLVMQDYMFSTPRKAADADVLLFSRQSFTEFPDLWVAGPDFRDMRRITAENPQQAQYNWGTAELVEWTSLDGIALQGILYKPENFDPSKKYPMISYFYERMSDGLHLHYPPVPHRSRINMTFYTSRGYLVFVPDIVYRIGYPGESAMNSIMPGVMKLLDRPYVDRDNLALQGHSWGGYQIAFMVTRTNLFRAAAPGAPVANMTSAYGGIRLESGMGRQFQYERTQSRLGGSLWDMPIRYIENSPLFWLDKVETPLLIMHNDLDGAVPWQQGIELYLGLRRLDKPAWLINYNDEPHWPTTFANKRDWNIRMQQFFDHYLQGAPAPVWLRDGIPALEKGSTLGYELTETVVDRR